MDTTKRVCALCLKDQTPLGRGLHAVSNRRGEPLGLFGGCCYSAVMQAVDESPRCYRWNPEQYGTNKRANNTIWARARQILGINGQTYDEYEDASWKRIELNHRENGKCIYCGVNAPNHTETCFIKRRQIP